MRRARGAQGMTLIEVVVTILVLTVGVLATLASFTGFSEAAWHSQQRAVLTSIAQQEIEKLRPLPYAQLGLSATPAPAAASEAPLTGPARAEALVMGGAVAPGGDEVEVQGVRARVYRYVTWRPQACPRVTAAVQTDLAGVLGQTTAAVSAALPDLCPATSRTKRLLVAVVPVEPTGETGAPMRLATVVGDPASATPVLSSVALKVQPVLQAVTGASPAAPAPTVTQQSFQLHDTPCDRSARQPPADHPTRATAAAGAGCSSSSAGRPDLMTTAPVPGAASDTLADYATDVTRAAAGGRVLMRDDRSGSCDSPGAMDYVAAEDERRYALHSWATPPATAPFETAASGGRAVLTLWTQTADQRPRPGRLCVVVRRHGTGAVLGSADFTLPSWPTEPTELSIAFDLAHAALPAGERLRVSLRVPSDSGADLGVHYDHPVRQSRLTVTSALGREFR